jgi:predicted RNA binding protein YcfA (HicA-like mRNA interferase family)
LSKKKKRLGSLFSIPAPIDFRWDELVSIMTECGFKNECNGGSHYTFEHTNGFVFTMSKTHPSGILKPYQVKAAKQALINIGVGDI